MTAIINSILNVSQIESGRLDLNLEDLDASEACRSIVRGFENRSPDHEFEIDIPEGRRVRADEGRFAQIVENLVDNAVKYSPAPAKIVVSADGADDGMVRFRVSDNGVGISREGCGTSSYRSPVSPTTAHPRSPGPVWASTSAKTWSSYTAARYRWKASHLSERPCPSPCLAQLA